MIPFSRSIIPVLLGLLPICALAGTPVDSPVLKERGETVEAHDARMAWFREARFGLFIHWGLYAQFGGERAGKPAGGAYGEWIMHDARIPVAEYKAAAKDFNPVNYDADAWARAAKGAGMKYIVITAKHHEGFAMFDSKVDDFTLINATPFKRDPLRELVAACRKHGLKIGFYYSQNLDWSHPGGGLRAKPWDPAVQKGDPDKYVDGLVIPQIRELLTAYGPIDIIWFDIPGAEAINKSRADRIMAAILAINPGILINDRLGGGYHGDTETPEQFVPAMGFPGRDWETCMTMNDTWGYKKRDHAWKSPEVLLRTLSDIVSKGGNFLLNVGPNERGEIPAASLERMAVVGKWMQVNGEAVYGTEASPFPRAFPWGRVTRRDNTLYLHLFNSPPDGRLVLSGLKTPVKSASVLGGAPVAITRDLAGETSLTLPSGIDFSLVPVIVATLDGPAEVDAKASITLYPNPKGVFELRALDASLSGVLRLENNAGNIGYWTKAEDTVTWRCHVDKAGEYSLKIEYSCDDANAGGVARISADGSLSANGEFEGIQFPVKSTGGFGTYAVSAPLALRIPKPGTVLIEIKAEKKPGRALMNVRRVRVEPKS